MRYIKHENHKSKENIVHKPENMKDTENLKIQKDIGKKLIIKKK